MTLDRFQGSLIGQCLGDAIGFVVEGQPPSLCEIYVQQSVEPWPKQMRGRTPFPFGQYTDDSQLARELLQSWVASGAFDPTDYGDRIGAIFKENRIVGRGRATANAAYRLVAGTPWHEAGEPAPAAGNGSAMRAGPVGLMCHADPAALVAAATDQGRVTHQDSRCSAGAIAVAAAVALALTDRTDARTGALNLIADQVAHANSDFAASIRKLDGWLNLPIEEAVVPISREGVAADFKDGWQGISPFVVGSVLWSLYAFFRDPTDYRAAIATAVRVGGDVDTTAAMTGAISGARVGLAGLPEQARAIEDQGTWRYEALLDLAQQAHALVS